VISASPGASLPLEQWASSSVFGNEHLSIERPLIIGTQLYDEFVTGLVTASGTTAALGVAVPTSIPGTGLEQQVLVYAGIIALAMLAVMCLGFLAGRRVARTPPH
jgi:hypothetical protein